MGITWESKSGSHIATLQPLEQFKTNDFRQVGLADGAWAVVGKLKASDDQLAVQSVVFESSNFSTLSDAKRWHADHESALSKGYGATSGEDLDAKKLFGSSINKHLVSVQRAEGGGEAGGVSPPTPSQLELVNQYTRTAKTADQVAVFPVMACNDLVDRDVDQFPEKTVRGFAKLPQPYSPLGKSFMVGHDYSNLPIGRIFDAKATNEDGVNWLKLWTYVPNTEQYKSYLENVDYGVYWAVSVGVMLGASNCSIGESHPWSWHPWFCSAKHMKGANYDASSEEVDDWGYPIEAEAGGELCFRKLEEPQDFYELSQVYLGAQYYAALDKGVGSRKENSVQLGGRPIKVFSLRSEELKDLDAPIPPQVPPGSPVAMAMSAGLLVERSTDDTFRWKDTSGLVWTFDPTSGEQLCLGKSDDKAPNPNFELGDVSPQTKSQDKPAESEEIKNVDKAAVVAAAQKANLSTSLLEQLQAAEGDGLEVVLTAAANRIGELEKSLGEANKKSSLGDAYIKALKADAVHWYTMAQRDPALPEKGVNTDTFVRLLELCGDNPELIEEHTKAYKDLARAKFPEAVRRSTFPADVNERTEVQAEPEEPRHAGSENAVSRLHR